MERLLSKKLEILHLLLILAISILLRINSMGAKSLWQDDAWVALGLKATNLDEFKLTAGHHPGFSLLLTNLYNLFGFSELISQLPSFIFGISIPIIGYFALKKNKFSSKFSLFFALVLASSPTLVLVSSRVKPYSFEAFIAVIYLFLLPLEKTLKKNILVFFLSLFSLLISFYSVFIIAGYYFAVIDYKKYKFKDNQNLYFGFFVFIFFVLSYNIYLSTLPLISATSIHPHVYIEWPLIDIFEGIIGGFNSLGTGTILPFYLLKWTSLSASDGDSLFYMLFYSFFTFLVLANTKRIYNFNEILAKYILSPIVITIIGTLFHRLIWGIGMPEQIRMLSSLIPGFAIWLLFSIQYSIKRQRVKSYGLATFYLFVFLTFLFYYKFQPYFDYPNQDYRAAIEAIKKDASGSSWIIKATDGTSPASALYDGSKEVEFGPGLHYSTKISKSELVDLSDSDYDKVYILYIENDRDLSSIGYKKDVFIYPDLGNLFVSKWEK